MLPAELLHLVQYFSTDYHNSVQNAIILYWKHLVDIWESGLAKFFWEYINRKLFAVQGCPIYL
jgi:hypothetical protein